MSEPGALSPRSRRVVVDPTRFAWRDPKLSVVGFDADQELPEVHEVVWAVQPDGEEEGVAPGIVRVVDHRYRLAYIEVVWSLFVTQPVVPHNHSSRGVYANCPACGTMVRASSTPTGTPLGARVSDLRARLLEVLRADGRLTPEQAERMAQDMSAYAEQRARETGKGL